MKNKTIKTAVFFVTILLCSLCVKSHGQDIQPFKAEEVKPSKAQEVKPVRVAKPARVKKATSPQPPVAPVTSPEKKQQQPIKAEVPASLFGLYQYWVPGTAYTIPDYTNNQLVVHNSAGTGVLPGGIKINMDGTYVWNSSWDGKIIKGNWRATGDRDYPLELLNAQEGKNWKIGKTTDAPSTITIWDGSTWYNGEKIKK